MDRELDVLRVWVFTRIEREKRKELGDRARRAAEIVYRQRSGNMRRPSISHQQKGGNSSSSSSSAISALFICTILRLFFCFALSAVFCSNVLFYVEPQKDGQQREEWWKNAEKRLLIKLCGKCLRPKKKRKSIHGERNNEWNSSNIGRVVRDYVGNGRRDEAIDRPWDTELLRGGWRLCIHWAV